jgi:hypothetical protein
MLNSCDESILAAPEAKNSRTAITLAKAGQAMSPSGRTAPRRAERVDRVDVQRAQPLLNATPSGCRP